MDFKVDNLVANSATLNGKVVTVNASNQIEINGTPLVTGGSVKYTESATAPSTPSVGDEWFDLTDGTLYKRISDGTTSAWISLNAVLSV